MFLIVAAMEEELRIAMELCRDVERMPAPGISIWKAERNRKPLCFLKAGVGPEKSARSLERALDRILPDRILIVGYAGALDPELQLGDLVAGISASAFRLDQDHPDWSCVHLEGTFDLTQAEELIAAAKSAGLKAVAGGTLSSPYVLGNPEHKDLLFRQFHASVVDMETAFLARTAMLRNIPVSCMRTVSDVAQDSFLAPFSFDPSINIAGRAKKLFDTGMAQTYREWKHHAAVARTSLRRFLEQYL